MTKMQLVGVILGTIGLGGVISILVYIAFQIHPLAGAACLFIITAFAGAMLANA